jgi:hypothetical protein
MSDTQAPSKEKVQTFTVLGITGVPHGTQLVKLEDYERLQAEVNRLRKQLFDGGPHTMRAAVEPPALHREQVKAICHALTDNCVMVDDPERPPCTFDNCAAMKAAARAAQPPGDALTQAARDVIGERRRQVTVEGWTPEHDDDHAEGEMASAAGCYALACFMSAEDRYAFWPWSDEWWKPKDFRSDLVRAGALILAEIERLDRAVDENG